MTVSSLEKGVVELALVSNEYKSNISAIHSLKTSVSEFTHRVGKSAYDNANRPLLIG